MVGCAPRMELGAVTLRLRLANVAWNVQVVGTAVWSIRTGRCGGKVHAMSIRCQPSCNGLVKT